MLPDAAPDSPRNDRPVTVAQPDNHEANSWHWQSSPSCVRVLFQPSIIATELQESDSGKGAPVPC